MRFLSGRQRLFVDPVRPLELLSKQAVRHPPPSVTQTQRVVQSPAVV
jgi:hypothetical protein